MSVLYPAFLWALAALAIPVLIHLFNLRQYKKVYFPHTRFLKNVVLQSRKQSELQQKLLLALRLLFLLFIIIAFAQPLLNRQVQKNKEVQLYVLYLDNSHSMGLKVGATDLLEKSKQAADQLLNTLPNNAQFFIITNEPTTIYEPVTKEQAAGLLADISFSSLQKKPEQVIQQTRSLMETEGLPNAEIFYFSDFQKNTTLVNIKNKPASIRVTGVALQPEKPENIYIDSAWLLQHQLDENNQLVVRSKSSLPVAKGDHLIQLKINDQLKSVTTPRFNADGISIDTLQFTINNDGWQNILVSIQDKNLPFDDSFRIAARMARQLQVEHFYQGTPSPYVVAALHSDPLMQVSQKPWQGGRNMNNAHLIVIEGITALSTAEGTQIKKAIAQGSSVVIFPGRTQHFSGFNAGLSILGNIRITSLDTVAQTLASLQPSHPLLRDIFEHIPHQIQLPTVNWHYSIQAGFQANQQAVMNFKNGDPFLANYDVEGGQLYLSAGSASIDAGNFTGSYFFVPFLYKMALLSHGDNSYAIRSGNQQAVHIPLQGSSERNLVHLLADGKDIIPVQKPSGNGVDIFVDGVVANSGFYTLYANAQDSVLIAVNPNILESQLQYHSAQELAQAAGDDIQFLTLEQFQRSGASSPSASFPIWKVCVLLALLLFAAESWVLWRNLSPSTGRVKTNTTSV